MIGPYAYILRLQKETEFGLYRESNIISLERTALVEI